MSAIPSLNSLESGCIFALGYGDLELSDLKDEAVKKAVVEGLFKRALFRFDIPGGSNHYYNMFFNALRNEVMLHAKSRFYYSLQINEIGLAIKIKNSLSLSYEDIFNYLQEIGVKDFETVNDFICHFSQRIDTALEKAERIRAIREIREERKDIFKNRNI